MALLPKCLVPEGRGGGNEGDFEDIASWDQQPVATARPAATSSGSVKESVLKMSALVDQTDDSELFPPKTDDVLARYFLAMGAAPAEEEEPTEAQLAGLHKCVMVSKQAPYVDFGVWLPFGRRALKAQKFRVYMLMGDGTYFMPELPTMDGLVEGLWFCTMAALAYYEKTIQKLVIQWPAAWGLICQAGGG